MTLVDDQWQVSWTPGVVAPAARRRRDPRRRPQVARRADIVDSSGGKIMTEREVAAVGIDKTKVPGAEAAASAKQLAGAHRHRPARFAAKVAAAGRQGLRRGRDPAPDRPGAREAGRRDRSKVKGALTVPAMQVLGPSRTWAAPILGTVGEATAEQIKASKGALKAGDTVGQTGLRVPLRRAAARHARPRRARRQARRRRQRARQARALRRAVDRGQAAAITLDPQAQTAAEAALAQQTAHPTALVAVRVSTGEVLAAAVGPGAERLDPRPRRQGGAGLDVQDRQLARHRAQGRDGRHDAAVHRDADGQRPPVQQLHDLPRRPARATSRCGPPSPTRATRPSSASTRR